MSKELFLIGKFVDQISKPLKEINKSLDRTRSTILKTEKVLDAVERKMRALRKVSAAQSKDYAKLTTSLKISAREAKKLNTELRSAKNLYATIKAQASRGLKSLGGAFAGAFTGAITGMSVGSAISSIGGGLMSDVKNFFSAVTGAFQKSTNFLRGQISKGGSLQSETISSANTMLTMADNITTWDQAMDTASDSISKMATLAAALPGSTGNYVTVFNGALDDQIEMFGSVEDVLKNVDDKGKQSFTALLALSGQMADIRPEMLLLDLAQFRQGQSVKNIQFVARNPLLQKKLTEAYASMLGMTTEAFDKMSPTKQSAAMKKIGVKGRMEALYEALQVSITPEAVAAMEKSWDGVTEGIKSTFLDPSSGLFGFGRRLADGQTIIEKLSLSLSEFIKPVMSIVSTVIGSPLDPLETLGAILNTMRFRAIVFGRKFEQTMESVFGSMDPEKIKESLSSESGRLKFADVIGSALAQLVNGVAEMVTKVLTGGAGSSSLTDPLTQFIDSVKKNLDYDAINVALQHLIKAGASLLLEYEGMRAKFINSTITAASKGAGLPDWLSKLIGEGAEFKAAPIGYIKNDNQEAADRQKLLSLLQEGGLSRFQAVGATDGNTLRDREVQSYKEILNKTDKGRAALADINKFLNNKGMKNDMEQALHSSGLFDGSPPYLRTMAFELLPKIIKETSQGNNKIAREVKNINAAIKAMASSSMSAPGGGGPVSPGKGDESLKKQLLEVFGGNKEIAAAFYGNIMQESQGDSTAENKASGAYGLAQWRLDRRSGLANFAAANGTSMDDQATQVKFIMHELKNKESEAWAAIQAASASGDVDDVTRAVALEYERMGHSESAMGNRVSQARSFAGGNLGPLMEEMRNKPMGSNLSFANDSELVANVAQTKKIAQGLQGGGNTYHIVVNSPGGSPREIADTIIRSIDQTLEGKKMSMI